MVVPGVSTRATRVLISLVMSDSRLRRDRPGSGLDERSRQVLREVVVSFVSSGEPVSSRTLAKSKKFSLSPATIRNIMADLEDLGYLTQPHTSAGRVPTDLGYRLFVDYLMNPRRVSSHDQEIVQHNLEATAGDQGPILQTASRVLSVLSDQVAVVLAPAASSAVIRSVHFVRVGENRFLAVIVTDANLVDHRLVVHDEDFNQAELDRLSRMLSEEFGGLTLFAMREKVLSAVAEEKVRYETELARMLPLADRALSGDASSVDASVYVEGTSRMITKPEFADVEKMRRIFRTFEEKARLASLLSGCLESRTTQVVIGGESPFTGDMDLAVVATGYGFAGKVVGTLGIVGPRRMDYSRLVPLVEYFGRCLGNRMAADRQAIAAPDREGNETK